MTYRDEERSVDAEAERVCARIAFIDARIVHLRTRERKYLRGAPPISFSLVLLIVGLVAPVLILLVMVSVRLRG